MHRNDIDRLELRDSEQVSLVTAADDGIDRRLGGLTVIAYDIPEGCCAGYYPECNVLVPLWHHAERAKVPAAKSVPVRIVRDGIARDEPPAPSDMVSGHPLSDAGRRTRRDPARRPGAECSEGAAGQSRRDRPCRGSCRRSRRAGAARKAPMSLLAAERPHPVYHDAQRRVWRHGLDADIAAGFPRKPRSPLPIRARATR